MSIRRITQALRKKDNPVFHFNDGSWKDGTYTGAVDSAGLPHGVGTKIYTLGGGPFSYKVGDKYAGEWQHGLYHGHGILTNANGSVRNEGVWRKGKIELEIGLPGFGHKNSNSDL